MIDNVPLLGSAERRTVPWWAAKGTGGPTTTVQVQLPDMLLTRLQELEDDLNIAASDLVAAYVEQAVDRAENRHARMLADIADHRRIKGWLPDGSPSLKDA